MQKRNGIIVAFLHGLSGDTNMGVCKVRALEQLYYLCNRSFVAPFSFANLLMVYFATGSKTVVSLLCLGLPCGSYSTLQVHDRNKELIWIKWTVIFINFNTIYTFITYEEIFPNEFYSWGARSIVFENVGGGRGDGVIQHETFVLNIYLKTYLHKKNRKLF